MFYIKIIVWREQVLCQMTTAFSAPGSTALGNEMGGTGGRLAVMISKHVCLISRSATVNRSRCLKYAPQVSTIKDLIRSEEHTSELQSRLHLVCRLLLEK